MRGASRWRGWRHPDIFVLLLWRHSRENQGFVSGNTGANWESGTTGRRSTAARSAVGAWPLATAM
jgi:hypothetical protein